MALQIESFPNATDDNNNETEQEPEASDKSNDVESADTGEKPYFNDDPPTTGVVSFIQWALVHGRTDEELIKLNFNPSSISVAKFRLKKDGIDIDALRSEVYDVEPSVVEESSSALQRVEELAKSISSPSTSSSTSSSLPSSPSLPADIKRLPPGKKTIPPEKPEKLPAVRKETIKTYAKGNVPPEEILNTMSIPDGVDGLDQFEKGIKFGASMVMMGVRIAQELSAIGIQQARPLVDMARDMRAGETAAAKSAAQDAAHDAAQGVVSELLPYLVKKEDKETSTLPAGVDPMRAMMADIMRPLVKDIFSKLVPGSGNTVDSLPSGWEGGG